MPLTGIAAQLFELVDELPFGRDGTVFTADYVREYTRKFRVITKDQAIGSILCCSAPGIPLPYAPYVSGFNTEYDLYSLCVNISATQDVADDWSQWVVTCKYSTNVPANGIPTEFGGNAGGGTGTSNPQGQGGAQNNPEAEPWKIGWDSETIHKALVRDRNGKAFLNSAGQPFTPPPTFDVGVSVLTIGRNEIGFNQQKASEYNYALNSDTFLGQPPGFAQCLPPKAEMIVKAGQVFWQVSYRIRFLPQLPDGTYDSWQPLILDQGLCRLDNTPGSVTNGKPVRIPNITSPVCLDGTGQVALKDAQGNVKPKFLDFKVYNTKSFMALFNQGLGLGVIGG